MGKNDTKVLKHKVLLVIMKTKGDQRWSTKVKGDQRWSTKVKGNQ